MILHTGERVYWGAPEVIYLEGTITKLDEATQTAVVHVERSTPHSAHLIDTEVAFSAAGLKPLKGASPPGTTGERTVHPLPPRQMSDEEKVRSAAAVAVHEQYGYSLPIAQENMLIDRVTDTLNSDLALRQRIIASMNEILQREF